MITQDMFESICTLILVFLPTGCQLEKGCETGESPHCTLSHEADHKASEEKVGALE